jgi:ATP-dependent Clp protease ATP-binding subunit ClpX
MKYDAPKVIKEYLDQYIFGQDEAKWKLTSAFFLYQMRLWQLYEGRNYDVKSHVLLLGPSGSGKTSLVKHLSNAVKFPVIHIDCSLLSTPGYSGIDIDESIHRQLMIADAKRGDLAILLLDEVDKISSVRETSSGGNHNWAIQSSLLSLLDGNTRYSSKERGHIDANKWFIVATGSFPELNKVSGKEKDIRQALVNLGMLPEFLNRFMNVAQTAELDSKAIHDIIFNSPTSPLHFYKEVFKHCDVDLQLTDIELHKIKSQIKEGKIREINGILFDTFSQRFKDLKNKESIWTTLSLNPPTKGATDND